jgi:hypothetical protein
MTDEHLDELDGLTPCPAPPELRANVLAAVDRQLAESGFDLPCATAGLSSSVLPASSCPISTSTRPSLEKLSAWTVAAALLVGIGLCAWQRNVVDARLASAFGPAPQSSTITDLVRDVESTSGPDAGRWLSERLVAIKSGHERQHHLDEPITTFPMSPLP